MIIECSYCEAKVDCTVLGEHSSCDPELGIPFKATFLECPVCKNALLAGQEYFQFSRDKSEWDDPVRLWPQPVKHFHWSLPELVRHSLDEAANCYKAKAYGACAVMCGRVLESICSEKKTKNKYLSGGLKELLAAEVIDKKIFRWGTALREHRNIGAHANIEKISEADAKDLLDFASAICDYVYVLNYKFTQFMERKEKNLK